ncbi:MAG: hypothetical protein IJU41_07170 [Clostridia bacterium]|nr:hypothetical protein [Clostridia bacterium]
MKKIICILLCAAALLLLAACGESGTLSAPYGFSLVSDTKIVDYALFVPSTWTVDKQGGITAAYYSELDPTSITVTLYALPEGVSDLDGYWNYYLDSSKDVYGAPEDLVTENVTLDGYEARQYTYSLSFGGDVYKFMQTVCLRGGGVYVITYASTAENFERHYKDVETTLGAFTFLK